MQPNLFLRTFWQLELKPQIFVAMSFSEQYQHRYENIIAPAITSLKTNGVSLTPYRVDLSKSGDSILTDIMDGIAHSQLILADVSSIGRDSKTGEPYRNGNVMYEVGLALASRLPHEVLLLRDDKDKFLFDVSTIPHMNLDFTDTAAAREAIYKELMERLKERNYINDARVRVALSSLNNWEIKTLEKLLEVPEGGARGWKFNGTVLGVHEMAIYQLLDKKLIKMIGMFDDEDSYPAYQLTQLGRIVAILASKGIPKYKPDPKN